MKQKRTYVTLLLIVALLCLGIAYAAITGVDLNISGNVATTAAEGKIDVQFTAATVGNKPDGAEVTAAASNLTGTIDVSKLTTAGQSVTVNYTIENKSTDIAATLGTPVVTFDNTEWFTVTCTLSGTDLAKNSDATTDDTQTATVVVTLNKTVVDTDDAAAAQDEISIKIDAEPVANS